MSGGILLLYRDLGNVCAIGMAWERERCVEMEKEPFPSLASNRPAVTDERYTDRLFLVADDLCKWVLNGPSKALVY
jgi:hypothetical protein